MNNLIIKFNASTISSEDIKNVAKAVQESFKEMGYNVVVMFDYDDQQVEFYTDDPQLRRVYIEHTNINELKQYFRNERLEKLI